MTYQGGMADVGRGANWTVAGFAGPFMRGFHTGAAPATTAWPANNDAYLYPFSVPTAVTFTGMFFTTGTTPGTTNFDLGIYRDDFTLITSLGATACVNTTAVPMPVGGGAFATPVTLTRGRYYMAMSSASTALTVSAATQGNQIQRALGMFKMASAHPLPSLFVPASMGATAFIPMVAMMTDTNTVL